MPASSKKDVLLAKAEPIRNGGSNIFKKGKKKSYCAGVIVAKEQSERNSSADIKICGEGEGGDAPGATAEIPLQPVVLAAVPMEVYRGAEIHSQPVEETHARAGGCLREGCEPMGNTCWSRVLARTCRPTERGAHTGAGLLVGPVTL
ncbi:protein pxr1-like [Pitangus sulphuratus]|nr:protein pxr1-like [Pitangus sulphuratus]